jgi:hypothetical protein
MFSYDVKKSVEDAKKDMEKYDRTNFKMLLKVYQREIDSILNEFGGVESDIPYDHEYFFLKNKYQYVLNHFTKE